MSQRQFVPAKTKSDMQYIALELASFLEVTIENMKNLLTILEKLKEKRDAFDC